MPFSIPWRGAAARLAGRRDGEIGILGDDHGTLDLDGKGHLGIGRSDDHRRHRNRLHRGGFVGRLLLLGGRSRLGLRLEFTDLHRLHRRVDDELLQDQARRMGDAQDTAGQEQQADRVHPDQPTTGVLGRLR